MNEREFMRLIEEFMERGFSQQEAELMQLEKKLKDQKSYGRWW